MCSFCVYGEYGLKTPMAFKISVLFRIKGVVESFHDYLVSLTEFLSKHNKI